MSAQTQNRLESRYGGITLDGHPHPLTAWFVVTLRLVMGGMILFAGLGKFAAVPGGEAFNAAGYLASRDAASPLSGMFSAMAGNAVLMDIVNVVVPVTQVLIGLALIAGIFVRLAALGGAMQMMMFYLGGWDGNWLGLFDNTLIYAVVFLAIGAFAAGRILGLDKHVEQLEIVQRYPKLRYLLG